MEWFMKSDVLTILHTMKSELSNPDEETRIAIANNLKMNVQIVTNWFTHQKSIGKKSLRALQSFRECDMQR